MNEIAVFVLDFSVPLGALLALSMAWACYRDARLSRQPIRRRHSKVAQ